MNTRVGYLAWLSAVVLSIAAPTDGAQAQWTSSRADGHAPIGVMGDHRHEAGEVMLSYRFMFMNMNGSRDGTSGITDQAVIDPTSYNFTVTPTKMPMMMHMVGVMYAPTDAITLMVMAPFLSIEMDHITRMGGTRDSPAFTTEASGVGDISVGGLVKLAAWGNQALHMNAGARLPTGSIEELDELPTSGGNDVQLPYPMQTGSGTFDVEPGITYLGQAGDWSWGGQGRATIRIGDNDHGYTLGNKFMGTFWGGRNLSRNAAMSLRVEAQGIGDIDGAEPAASVNPAVVPTARTDLRSGTRVDGGIGLNLHIPPAKGMRFAAELLFPLYQDLDSPQLETDWTLVLGFQIVPVAR